jgi:hypothetical protein
MNDEEDWGGDDQKDQHAGNGAIKDMLQMKYIYSRKDSALDVLDQLRIERLRREFQRSQPSIQET